MSQLSSPADYSQLFALAPVSLWLEDFSAVKRRIEKLRTRGIQDFRTFINVHFEFVSRCMLVIPVIGMTTGTRTSSDQLQATLIRADRAVYVEKTCFYQEPQIERRGHSS